MRIDGRIGKTLTEFVQRHADKIDEVVADNDGFWIYTEKGWANPEDVEFHTYHEETQTLLMESFRRWLPVPCSCSRCTN